MLVPEDPIGDEVVEVSCPYCGETVELLVDPGGADSQEYVQDCEVCCQPWNVTVWWDESGNAIATAETEDG